MPRRVPLIAAEGGHQHQSIAVANRYREHRRALLARPSSGGDEFDERHPEGFAEDPSLRGVEDRSVDACAYLVERVLGLHARRSLRWASAVGGTRCGGGALGLFHRDLL